MPFCSSEPMLPEKQETQLGRHGTFFSFFFFFFLLGCGEGGGAGGWGGRPRIWGLSLNADRSKTSLLCVIFLPFFFLRGGGGDWYCFRILGEVWFW